MSRWAGWAAAIGLTVSAPAALGHHSLAHYDSARPLALQGVVTEYRYANPHPYLVIAVSGEGAQSWRLEMDNLYELDAIGMSRDSFKPGDHVSISASPNRDGSRTAYLRRLDRARDGLRYEQVGSSPVVTVRSK